MVKTDSRQLIEIVGVFSVVLSLLIVAWEIRQNTTAISAQALLSLNDMANATLRSETENRQLAEVLAKGDEGIEPLSPSELRQYQSWVYQGINNREAAYIYYSKGLLSEEDYAGWNGSTCSFFRVSSRRAVWTRDKDTFVKSFVAYVEGLCNFEPGLGEEG